MPKFTSWFSRIPLRLTGRHVRRAVPAPADPGRSSHPWPETVEERCLLSASPFYSIDGTGNNLNHPDWGSVGQDLLRTAPAQYADGLSALAGANRPSA